MPEDVADIRGEKDEHNSSVTVKSFITSFVGTLPPSPVYTHHSKRWREQTSPENAFKLRHIILIKIIVNTNVLQFTNRRCRTPSPESQCHLRHGVPQHIPQGRSCPRGNYMYIQDNKSFLRTGRVITNVADLGRDSQKVLPRCYLRSSDSVVYWVTSSGGHTISLQNTL